MSEILVLIKALHDFVDLILRLCVIDQLTHFLFSESNNGQNFLKPKIKFQEQVVERNTFCQVPGRDALDRPQRAIDGLI